MRRAPAHASRLAHLALLAVAASCRPGEGKTAYVGATVWDGTGGPPILDAVILVSGNRVEAIGPPEEVRVPKGALEVRLDGRFVIPGLIDAHTHATRWSLERYLAYGVTAVRHLGGPEDSALALRDEVNSGATAGPWLFVSGAPIDAGRPVAPYAHAVTTSDEARRAIDQLVLKEVAQAKIHSGITPRLLEPLMDEARTLSLPVAAHLGKTDALTAARLGVRSLEHASGVAASAMPNAPALFAAYDVFARGFRMEAGVWSTLDSAALDRVAAALAETGVVVVPTLIVYEGLSRLHDAGFFDALDRRGVPEDRQSDPADLAEALGVGTDDIAALRRARPKFDLFVRRFMHHGGVVAAGTDSPSAIAPPGASLHHELALLVAAGLTPAQALLAATRDAARLAGADDLGTIAPGTFADFLVLSADPLADIRNSATVETIVQGGVRTDAAHFKESWRR